MIQNESHVPSGITLGGVVFPVFTAAVLVATLHKGAGIIQQKRSSQQIIQGTSWASLILFESKHHIQSKKKTMKLLRTAIV
jgi:hypothetical protein